MDIVATLAVAFGLAGVVLGCLGLWKAREVEARAASANHLAQEATKAAAEAHRIAVDARTIAESRRERAPEAVRKPARPRVHSADNEKTAHLVVRSGNALGQDMPTNQGSGSGLIGIFLINEGPAVAHDLRLDATFPNGTIRNSETHKVLSVNKELTLSTQVIPADFGPDAKMVVLYRISFRDGNGEQEIERLVRVEGGWKGPWQTFLEADANGLEERLSAATDPAQSREAF